MELTGSISIPGYRMIRRVGSGAFGDVWMAEELLTGVTRAIKLLNKSSASQQADPLKELHGIREYQQKSKDHPSLLQIYHVGESPEFFYYAMELADDATIDPGKTVVASPSADYEPLTLATLIEREAPMPATRALDIATQVLAGLEHLHGHGLFHRDVKPSNVLVVDSRIKLADMGLVTLIDRDVTQVGTPGYMPPDARLDHTADLYAVGIMLYEMITGLHRSQFPELPVLSPKTRRERGVLRVAIRITNKAAHPDRRQRYTTARAFAHDATVRRLKPRRRWRKPIAAIVILLFVVATLLFWKAGIAHHTPSEISSIAATRWIAVRAEGISPRAGDYHTTSVNVEYSVGGPKTQSFPWQLGSACTVDLDDTGEPLIAIGFADEGPYSESLVLFDAHDFRAMEKPIPSKILNLREQKDIPKAWYHQNFDKSCIVHPSLAAGFDGEPGQELVVSVVFEQGPTHIIVFSRGLDRLADFWLYGHMGFTKAHDIDRDGKLELICWSAANKREPPPPYGGIHEPFYSAVLVLNPRSPPAFGSHWSMNDWMNESSTWINITYGIVRYPWGYGDDPRSGQQEENWTIDRLIMTKGDPGMIRMILNHDYYGELLLELNSDLSPYQLRSNKSSPPNELDLAAEDVWCKIGVSGPPCVVKEPPSGGE